MSLVPQQNVDRREFLKTSTAFAAASLVGAPAAAAGAAEAALPSAVLSCPYLSVAEYALLRRALPQGKTHPGIDLINESDSDFCNEYCGEEDRARHARMPVATQCERVNGWAHGIARGLSMLGPLADELFTGSDEAPIAVLNSFLHSMRAYGHTNGVENDEGVVRHEWADAAGDREAMQRYEWFLEAFGLRADNAAFIEKEFQGAEAEVRSEYPGVPDDLIAEKVRCNLAFKFLHGKYFQFLSIHLTNEDMDFYRELPEDSDLRRFRGFELLNEALREGAGVIAQDPWFLLREQVRALREIPQRTVEQNRSLVTARHDLEEMECNAFYRGERRLRLLQAGTLSTRDALASLADRMGTECPEGGCLTCIWDSDGTACLSLQGRREGVDRIVELNDFERAAFVAWLPSGKAGQIYRHLIFNNQSPTRIMRALRGLRFETGMIRELNFADDGY